MERPNSLKYTAKIEENMLGTPYEVEVKFPLSDKDSMKEKIRREGGVALNSEYQMDTYYDHPCRTFFVTDESIRVRHRKRTKGQTATESGHTSVELTYKGPKIDTTTKTRLEHSVNLEEKELDSIKQILLNTGFKHVGEIIKHRDFYDIKGITVSIDTVTDVGSFIEFELIAESNEDMEVAKKRILDLVKQLGLDANDSIRTSYLELYLENKV